MSKNRKSEKVHSLFVGRWQPFHAGHKKLMETVLKKGKPIVVAIRDTQISHANPYTTEERWIMIQEALAAYGSLVKIVVIPDIDEICYGREVGYAVRKIDLDRETERVSGTKVRAQNSPLRKIVWLTGNSGAGKTTLANALVERIPGAVILDGDEMRESISRGAGFSKKDREEHNLRVARLALALAKRSPVIVSVIAPFRTTRARIDAVANPIWVYVRRKVPVRKTHPYEAPRSPHLTVDSDLQSPEQNASLVKAYLERATSR